MITHEISNDNLIVYKTESSEEEESLREILGLEEEGLSSKKGKDYNLYNFTGFVVFMITVYE